jgi:hypothetical protein
VSDFLVFACCLRVDCNLTDSGVSPLLDAAPLLVNLVHLDLASMCQLFLFVVVWCSLLFVGGFGGGAVVVVSVLMTTAFDI